jgi:hypothetical protein
MRNPIRTWHLLTVAAIFHLAVTLTVWGLGRYAVLPGTFDESGIAISIASDGSKLRVETIQRSDELQHGQIRDWLNANSPFHVKLYSISFALLTPLFGATVLSAEPLNSIFYLAIVVLTFYVGRELFSRNVGRLAAGAVALWPSFLLHTTQLLRDPLFVAAMMGFIFVNVCLLTRILRWSRALVTAAIGGALANLIWLLRDTIVEVLIATAALAGLLLLIRIFSERRFDAGNSSRAAGWRERVPALVSVALLLMLSIVATRVIPKFRRTYTRGTVSGNTNQDIWQGSRRGKRDLVIATLEPSANPWSRLVARIGKLRQGFVLEFSDAGSNIDTNVVIASTADLIFYLPRATLIGFCAPFPNMWFAVGTQVSRGGRLLSGVETMVMYLVEVFAVVTLWKRRRDVSVWFLWLVAAMGVISLGLVVVNIGALFRLRYVFVILLIILGAEGARLVFEQLVARKLVRPRH